MRPSATVEAQGAMSLADKENTQSLSVFACGRVRYRLPPRVSRSPPGHSQRASDRRSAVVAPCIGCERCPQEQLDPAGRRRRTAQRSGDRGNRGLLPAGPRRGESVRVPIAYHRDCRVRERRRAKRSVNLTFVCLRRPARSPFVGTRNWTWLAGAAFSQACPPGRARKNVGR